MMYCTTRSTHELDRWSLIEQNHQSRARPHRDATYAVDTGLKLQLL